MPDSEAVVRARKFLAGLQLSFAEADATWQQLRDDDNLSLARQVLQKLGEDPDCLLDGPVPNVKKTRDVLCQQEALLTSKDAELSAASRHDDALMLLAGRFEFIQDKTLPGDTETLGIAGGIAKRKWNDLGQLKDLLAAADFYERGARNGYGTDAYPHINAAFLEDLLAEAGDRPEERRQHAKQIRQD